MLKPQVLLVAALDEVIIIILQLFAFHFAVVHRGIDVGVAQDLLEEPGIIEGRLLLHGVYGESVSELMGRDVMLLIVLRINELEKTSSLRAVNDNLPGPLPAYIEELTPPIDLSYAALFNVLADQLQGVLIDRYLAQVPFFLCLGYGLFDVLTAGRAEYMLLPAPGATLRSGKIDAHFLMLYLDLALGEVYVLFLQSEYLADTSAEPPV